MAESNREWTKFGRYALLQKIGAGGMAEIYRAKTFGAAGFEKEFAIKLILPSLVDDTEFVEMFINEAKIAVSLYHANVVQVFDLGELDNQYYIAMEFVHGKDLLDVLARCAELNIKIPLNLVLFIAMEMLKGLDFAHRAKDPYGDDLNIIHRDVSPSNILISYAGDVKVGDFGVAKAAIQRNLTESGTLKGKVGYMSPEQVMGEEIDSRSDIFSACIVFVEALSMNRLFVGSSDLDVMLKVRDADVEASLEKMGPLPSDLVQIIRTGLARHREDRYQSAGEFYQALMDFCFQHSIKVSGNDLSNLMRRLFAREIEEEKSQRRSEPGGLAAQRLFEESVPKEAPAAAASEVEFTPEQKSDKSELMAMGDTAAVRDPQNTGRMPARELAGQVARSKEPDAPAEEEGDERRYRYRDGSGLVFGPMGPQTLVDLLRVRRPRADDRVAVGDGPWVKLDEVSEIEVPTGRATARRARPVAVEATLDAATRGGDTDVMRDVRRAVGAMEEESAAAGDTDVMLDERDSLAAGSTDVADMSPPSAAEAELGAQSSPVSQSPPSMGLTMTEGALGSTFQELKNLYASYEGELAEVSFARILGRLHRAGETGRLFVTNGQVEKSIFIRSGEPIYVDSNRREELLGHFLRTRDLITEAQLQEGLARLNEWGGRLGDALVAIGAIPAHAIFTHLSSQMREKLLEIFTWPEGYYGYYENQEPDTQGYSLGLDTYEMIVEGCREQVPLARIKELYRNRNFVSIYLNEPAPFSVDRLRLRANELRVLNQLSAGDNLRALLAKFTPDQHEKVYRTVYLLHQVEILVFEVTERVDLPKVD
ncbi:protein kinase [Lujinxingia vulgaris]|uniref:Protein kinase n=1 Tax=Lujinxingia vulgaris TaxID=2600176 RepID=A0A5C6XC39_9DELT|nr:protein kinase [Lujinxingia vulgaris]TXD34955.1 protein kinase [Lujinxingia vulgaris]